MKIVLVQCVSKNETKRIQKLNYRKAGHSQHIERTKVKHGKERFLYI